LILVISLVTYSEDKLINAWLKNQGYNVGNFTKVDLNRNFYEQGKTQPPSKLVDGDGSSIIYIAGRHLNYKIEKEEKGYTRNLLNKLIEYSKNNNLSLYYIQTANNLYSTEKGSSNEMDLIAVKNFYNKHNKKKILIGMSFGALLVEHITCLNQEAYGIPIGGSLRALDLTKKDIFINKIELKTCLQNPRLFNVIGSRDGDFEKQNTENLSGINYAVYKGHHYITNSSIDLVVNNLDSIIPLNE